MWKIFAALFLLIFFPCVCFAGDGYGIPNPQQAEILEQLETINHNAAMQQEQAYEDKQKQHDADVLRQNKELNDQIEKDMAKDLYSPQNYQKTIMDNYRRRSGQ
jgi:hypothetical protein